MSRMRVRMELSMWGLERNSLCERMSGAGGELLIHCEHKIKRTNYYVGEKKIQPALEGKPILNYTPMLSSQCHALETTEFLPFFLRMQVLNSALVWKPNLMQSWKNKASTQLSPRWTHPVSSIPLMPLVHELHLPGSDREIFLSGAAVCRRLCDYDTTSILPRFCVIQLKGRVWVRTWWNRYFMLMKKITYVFRSNLSIFIMGSIKEMNSEV